MAGAIAGTAILQIEGIEEKERKHAVKRAKDSELTCAVCDIVG